MIKYFAFVTVLFFFHLNSFAEDIFVVSNADNGAGTLRDALSRAAANGNVSQDRILFNLPGTNEADLTINVLTQLPLLSSNLIIDATTQNGKPFSFSDARVLIKSVRQPFNHFTIFKGNGLHNLEFYGMYFWDTNVYGQSDPNGPLRIGIGLENCEEITIGKAFKGNSFDGYNDYTIQLNNVRKVKIAANTFTPRPDVSFWSKVAPIRMHNVIDLEFGGTNEGNALITGVYIELESSVQISKMIFKDNNFGVFADGLTTLHAFQATVRIIGRTIKENDPKPPVDISFTGNLFSHYMGSGIQLSNLAGKAEVKRNWFGTDRLRKLSLNLRQAHPGSGTAMWFERFDGDIIVGDESVAEGNVIAYTDVGINMLAVTNLKLMRNSFKCIGTKEFVHNNSVIPLITVNSSNAAYIKGTADPGAIIDVFLSDDCINCSPETYLGSTTADAAGNWQYDHPQPVIGYVVANAHLGKKSSNFSKTWVDQSKMTITHFRCDGAGSIKGLSVLNTHSVKWVDRKGNIVSTSVDLIDVPAGEYKLVAGSYCPVETQFFEVRDMRPMIYADARKLQLPTCDQLNGSITRISIIRFDPQEQVTFRWINEEQKVVGNAPDLTNVGPGIYTLMVESTNGCELSYGPITLNAQGAPVINQANQKIVGSLCGSATGAITDISVTGTGNFVYTWKDSKQQIVGNSKDLINIAAGVYFLEVKDEGVCGPSQSAAINVPEINGITIDDQNIMINPATCNKLNGAIKNLAVLGADEYSWVNSEGTIVSSSLVLENMSAGNYQLIASNSICSKRSKIFSITAPATNPFPEYAFRLQGPVCGQNNGMISLDFGLAEQPVALRWINEQGQTIGNSAIATGLDEGNYSLYLTDKAGCESFYKSLVLRPPDPFVVDISNVKITDDLCAMKTGSISGITVNGGIEPYSLIWKDDEGTTISSVNSLIEGVYTLEVSDASGAGCNMSRFAFRVSDRQMELQPPVIPDIYLCSPGEVEIKVADLQQGQYHLYNGLNATSAIDENHTGTFTVVADKESEFFVSFQKGNCVSLRVPVKIFISDNGLKTVSVFTPNGDGINDSWKIAGIENYPYADVKIFNRYGNQVYHSLGYGKPFTGRIGSLDLPSGIYYYYINLKSGCKPMSGSVTIIR